jgi:farnesyl diphosphate synthase
MLPERLDAAARAVQAHFDDVIGALDDLPVLNAMAHATAGGKRLRGFLVLETARLHGIEPAQAIWPATAIEALHAYSLVHDDLPCMDDDDLRRGLPTVHVKWDDATAVLAGDALQSLAFEMVSDARVGNGDVRAELTRTLAIASGARGMVLGQALDIAAETASSPLTLDEITALQQGKTGALISWSAMAGPRMAGADAAPLAAYASAIGLAFQIADDILDIEGDAATVGKATGKDAHAGKATFVSLLGLDGAKSRAQELVQSACDALSIYGKDGDILRDTARFVVARKS